MTAAWARAFTAAETRTRTSSAASTWWALSRRPSHSTAKMKVAARFAPRISPLFARKLRQASKAPNAITGRITTLTVDRTPADCFMRSGLDHGPTTRKNTGFPCQDAASIRIGICGAVAYDPIHADSDSDRKTHV